MANAKSAKVKRKDSGGSPVGGHHKPKRDAGKNRAPASGGTARPDVPDHEAGGRKVADQPVGGTPGSVRPVHGPAHGNLVQPQPNRRFLTGGLGEALEAQNARTILALQAAHIDIKVTNKALADMGPGPGRTALITKSGRTIYLGHESKQFEGDYAMNRRIVSMGETLAGVDNARPIVWPDMTKVAEAAKVPMTPETKERLAAIAKAKPRSVGDEIAMQLDGKSLPEVYEAAAKYLGEAVTVLMDKYKHLNPGQQRMVCGNRMRAKWKAENLNAKTRGKDAEKKVSGGADRPVPAAAKPEAKGGGAVEKGAGKTPDRAERPAATKGKRKPGSGRK